jgi:adenylate cyclase
VDGTGDGRGALTASGLLCGSCGTELSLNSKFCNECGAPVTQVSRSAEYKQVTVLFADVVHSMDIAAAVGAERLREIMAELVNRASSVVQGYGGTVDKFTGDGIMAVFGAPVALEDHAFRACLAALGIQEEAKRLAVDVRERDGVELQLRVGLNSGQVIAGEIGSGALGYTAIGEQVGMAQRMESVAPPGGVMLSESTARLVEHATLLEEAEKLDIKGSDAPVVARCLLGVAPQRERIGSWREPLVGRELEVSTITGLLDRSMSGRGCVVCVAGPAGIGKTRLVGEAVQLAKSRDVEVFSTFCESHATDIALRVVTRLWRAAAGVMGLDDENARARVRERVPDADEQDLLLVDDLLGIADPEVSLPRIDPDARRRRLTALVNAALLARTRPALYVIEDAHWIDAVSESMLADFFTVIPQTPSMVVITYRPEYEGTLTRIHGAQTIALAPLSDPESSALVAKLLGPDSSVGEVGEAIVARAAGNPFFAQEMIRDLAERGVLQGTIGSYVCHTDVAEVSVPATLHAAIGARIDRLGTGAKKTINAAAVIGLRFTAALLTGLEVDSVLDELTKAELIDQVRFTPRAEYAFRHPLIRAVAYESQLKSDRAQLHRRLAAAIEVGDPQSADENAALIAEHLETAGDLHAAYRWHMRAAEWLRPRDALAARARWESARCAADRLPDDHTAVLDMRLAPRTMLISTSFYVGDDVDIDGLYGELRDLTMQTGDLRSLALAMAGRIQWFADHHTRVPEAATLATDLEEMATGIDCDAATKSILLNAVAMARFVNCEFEAALQVIDEIAALTEVPAVEIALARAIRGSVEICLGDYELGRRHLQESVEQGHALPPVVSAQILFFSSAMVVLGMSQADDLVDDVHEALRRAEEFGDSSGIMAAQYSYGITLLCAEGGSPDDALDVLQRLRTDVEKHKMFKLAAATLDAVLEIDAARKGKLDEAIDVLRASFALHMSSGSRVFVGCPGEALVGLLIERGSTDDLVEAHRIVDQWPTQRLNIPALDLWWLKSRALLAEAEGNSDYYTKLANQYLRLCERLDARGRLSEARRMVNEIT